jgi:hypothetical protein
MMKTGRVGGPIPAHKPGDPELTIRDLAEAIAPIAPDVAGTVQRIRHWTRGSVLFPVRQAHGGPGKHQIFTEDAIYECAVLHILTLAGLPVSGPRLLRDTMTAARYAVPKWRTAQRLGQPLKARLVVEMTDQGSAMTDVLWEGAEEKKNEESKEGRRREAAIKLGAVFKFEIDLGKLFEKVDHHGRS